MFYTFYQNPTGGVYHYNEHAGITKFVIIEADSARHANDMAIMLGIYFYGAAIYDDEDNKFDGNRWSPTDECYGYETPIIYAWSPEEYMETQKPDPLMNGCPEIAIHKKIT